MVVKSSASACVADRHTKIASLVAHSFTWGNILPFTLQTETEGNDARAAANAQEASESDYSAFKAAENSAQFSLHAHLRGINHRMPMEESPHEWILKRRHEDLSLTVRTSWSLYIQFYTVFLTVSVVGLGWVLTPPADAQIVPRAKTCYCRRFCDSDALNRDNKRRDGALYDVCGTRPGAHRKAAG